MTEYVEIDDKYIWMVWCCDNCGETFHVRPDWYQDNGTPVCDCDNDMSYIKTEVQKIILLKSGTLTEVKDV